MSSLINTTNRNADEMTTGAYNTALQRQQQLGLAGIGYNVGQQQLYDPNAPIRSGTSAYGTGAQAGADLNKMGSTFGDVMSGLGGIASLATMPINPTSAFGRLTGPKPPGS
jgi:hypothetical protein